MKTLVYLLFVFTILNLSHSSLVIYQPTSFAQKNTDDFNYTIANFGHIPYGKTLVGKIIVANPSTMCQIDNIIQQKKKNEPNILLFALIERGLCKFTNKTFNAQKSGADLSIIVDTNNSESGKIVMANDGFGFLVQIPSIFISNSSGQTLKKLVKESGNQLIVKIKFDTEKSDKVGLRMWLDSNDRHSYVLMRDFADFHKLLKNHMNTQLLFKIIDNCSYCEPNNCIVNSPSNRYCYIPSRNSVMTGKQVIEASLRSYFAFKQNQDKWWEYMNLFDKNCSMLKNHSSCAEQLLSSLKYDIKKINQAIQVEKTKAIQGADNAVFKNWSEQASRGNILFYPDVTINNINYQGELIASDIFQMICNSLNTPPFECYSFVDQKTESEQFGTSVGAIIFYTLLIMTLGFIAAMIIFKRCLKKRMQSSIANQVNHMVSQYVAFYDKDGKSTEQRI